MTGLIPGTPGPMALLCAQFSHTGAGRTPHAAPRPIRSTRPMFASSYPLLDLFWTMLEIFVFILWIWLLIAVFADIFRSHDMGGVAKALWVIFVIIFPFL